MKIDHPNLRVVKLTCSIIQVEAAIPLQMRFAASSQRLFYPTKICRSTLPYLGRDEGLRFPALFSMLAPVGSASSLCLMSTFYVPLFCRLFLGPRPKGKVYSRKRSRWVIVGPAC